MLLREASSFHVVVKIFMNTSESIYIEKILWFKVRVCWKVFIYAGDNNVNLTIICGPPVFYCDDLSEWFSFSKHPLSSGFAENDCVVILKHLIKISFEKFE